MPEEPVTFDQLEGLLLQLMGTLPEALEQQILSHIKRETLVGGKRVTRQELPELPKDAATTVHRVKVSLYGAKPPVQADLVRDGGGLGDDPLRGQSCARHGYLPRTLLPSQIPAPVMKISSSTSGVGFRPFTQDAPLIKPAA